MEYKEKVIALLKSQELSKEQKEKLENIFPELKEELESERIRKAIIEHFEWSTKRILNEYSNKKVIDWLEKQGEQPRYSIGDVLCDKLCTTLNKDAQPNFEIIDIRNGMYICDKGSFPISQQDEYELVAKKIEQKHADKVEPKFKKGDWVVNKGHSYLIADIDFLDNRYLFEIGGYTHEQLNWEYIENVDNKYHLWTIEDAKDGDVLATSAGAFIYNGNNGGGSCPGCYCGIDTLGGFKTGVEHHWTGKKVYPATKEQRDILFKRMKEAGYEWDAEKKELKKIEPKPWSEEDEEALEVAIIALEDMYSEDSPLDCYAGHYMPFDRAAKQLKAIKDRVVPQPKQEWSEEDDSMVEDVRNSFEFHCDEMTEALQEQYNKFFDKVKSLRPQTHWKPSERDLGSLTDAIIHYEGIGIKPNGLKELLEQLKKLREE